MMPGVGVIALFIIFKYHLCHSIFAIKFDKGRNTNDGEYLQNSGSKKKVTAILRTLTFLEKLGNEIVKL